MALSSNLCLVIQSRGFDNHKRNYSNPTTRGASTGASFRGEEKDEGPKIEVLEDDEDQKPKLPQIEGPRSKIEDVDSQCIFCGDIATRMKKFNNKIKICDKIKCEKVVLKN